MVWNKTSVKRMTTLITAVIALVAAISSAPAAFAQDAGGDSAPLLSNAVQQWDAGTTIAGIALDPATGDTVVLSEDGTLSRFSPVGEKIGQTSLLDYEWIATVLGEKPDTSRWSWGMSQGGTIVAKPGESLGDLLFASTRGGGAAQYGQCWVFAFTDGSQTQSCDEALFANVPHPLRMSFFLPETDDEIVVGFVDAENVFHVARLAPSGVINHWYVPELAADQSGMVVASIPAAREAANRVATAPDGTIMLAGVNAANELVAVRLSSITDGTSNTIMQVLGTCEQGCGQMVVVNHEEQWIVGRRGITSNMDAWQFKDDGLINNFNIGMPPTLNSRVSDDALLQVVFDAGDGFSLLYDNRLARIHPDGKIESLIVYDDMTRGVMILPYMEQSSLLVANRDGSVSVFNLD